MLPPVPFFVLCAVARGGPHTRARGRPGRSLAAQDRSPRRLAFTLPARRLVAGFAPGSPVAPTGCCCSPSEPRSSAPPSLARTPTPAEPSTPCLPTRTTSRLLSCRTPPYGAVDPDDAAKPQEKAGGGKYADKSSDRFWLDIAAAAGAAVAIVTTFFVTISYMNYTYKHTQLELHTECVSSEVKERMRARGFDFDVDEIRHAYVVTKGGDPIKMAPVAGRPGAYRVSTYVANNEWWFAVESQATGAEKMYEEVGDETASPAALETNTRCVTREADGTFVRELAEEALVDGAEVSHVFGSCDYSCSSSVPPVEVSTTETSASRRERRTADRRAPRRGSTSPGTPRIPTRTSPPRWTPMG